MATTVSFELPADLAFAAAMVIPAASSAVSLASNPATDSVEGPDALDAAVLLRAFHRAAPKLTPVSTSAERWTSLNSLGIPGRVYYGKFLEATKEYTCL